MTKPGPDRPRKASQQRAADAYNHRCMGRTWREIAQLCGFKSHSSAAHAVRRHINRMPAEDRNLMKAVTAGSYRIVTARLHRLLAQAEQDGDATAAATLGRTIADIEDKHAKLTDQYSPTKVDLTVHQTAGAVIDRAEAELLALAGEQPAIPAPVVGLPVLDAEIIDVPASGPSESVPQPITPEEA